MFTQVRPFVLVAGVAAMLMGCSPEASVEPPVDGIDMGSAADSAPAEPRCPAAQGTEGDVLLCADFAKIRTLAELEEAGWDFSRSSAPGCWEIRDGALSNSPEYSQNFSCSVTVPETDLADYKYAKYNRISLVVNFKIDIQGLEQSALASLFARSNGGSIVLFKITENANGFNNEPVSRSYAISFKKKELPPLLNYAFKPGFITYSRSPNSGTGWQISSLAIVGSY